VYKPRRPEKTVLHAAIRKNLNTWYRRQEVDAEVPHHVQKEFNDYLKCGILAHGFARAHCKGCKRDFLIAFSCKRRGICPSCNQRRMITTAQHLIDNVYPRVRVRQFVISFPKRIRPFLKNKKIRQAVLKIVVGEIEKGLIECSINYPNAQPGGVSFFQQFGSSLNFHPHFHLCFTDGVFLGKEGRLTFCQSNISPDDILDIENGIRKRVLKLFGRKEWIEKEEAESLMQWENSGFSLDGSVCVEAWDRAGLERLLRYCGRPPFVSENFKTYRDKIVYTLPKPTREGMRLIQLTPLELISRLSKLIPDPRCHQHHYHSIFAPNAPFRKELVQHANKGIDEHVPFIEMPIEMPSEKKVIAIGHDY